MKTTFVASCGLALAVSLCVGGTNAQGRAPRGAAPDPDHGRVLPPPETAPEGSEPIAKDWKSAVRVLRVPGAGDSSTAEATASAEIFPDADKVYMQVIGTDAKPIEAARRGARRWICSSGCALTLPQDEGGGSEVTTADEMLQSIKLQTPTTPLPLTIWTPVANQAIPGAHGKLLFDPRLMGRREYKERCAYAPVSERAKIGDVVGDCWTERKLSPPMKVPPAPPDTADLLLGLRWPATSELAQFQYLAITDTCGNAMVYPFQRTVSVPVYLVASGGCGNPDGRTLRAFPSGGWVRVSAFNLDSTAAGSVASVTFRVTVPPLEDLVTPEPPPLLFPDARPDDLIVDCGPQLLKARSGPGGIPRSAPGEDDAPAAPSPDRLPAPKGAGPAPTKPTAGAAPPPPPMAAAARTVPGHGPQGQPLAHQSLVIAPEPIKAGNCRIEYRSQNKRRLIAPLALRVRITRTDVINQNGSAELLDEDWVITPTDTTFRIPQLATDGESRLLLEVFSNPGSAAGNVVMLGDGGRYQRKDASGNPLGEEQLRRLIGSVTIHTAPLCGESNFETAEQAGRCLRGYFTVPAMLATLQVTRAPWVERPLITRSVLSAVGVAFALDSYDPVERKAFPIAMQLGGFIEDLGDSRLGFTSYLGVAPTVPILGSGGNTTNIGLLGGLGMSYVTRSSGPDEGFKPTAFLSVIVQVGQVNPALADAEGSHFGTYQAPSMKGGTY